MTEAKKISTKINELVPNAKSGTIRFFGEWFGRPYDNQHKIIAASATDDVLTIKFSGDEQLVVWNPRDYAISETEFEICKASRVLWKWYYYGRESKPENERFEDFEVDGDQIRTSHNIDWYDPVFQPTITEPAVRIYSYYEDPILVSVDRER